MFRALLIVLLLSNSAIADTPPRYHKGGATVAKYHNIAPKSSTKPKQPKQQPAIRYIVKTYHKGS